MLYEGMDIIFKNVKYSKVQLSWYVLKNIQYYGIINRLGT